MREQERRETGLRDSSIVEVALLAAKPPPRGLLHLEPTHECRKMPHLAGVERRDLQGGLLWRPRRPHRLDRNAI